MLFLILGSLGGGKTLLATILAELTEKQTIFANYTIKNKKWQKFDLTLLFTEKLKNALVIIDEAYTYLEARTSLQLINKVMSYVLFHSRKIDIDFILTAQLISSIDKRFRKMADFTIIAEKKEKYFRYLVYQKAKFVRSFFIPFSIAENYYHLFDTLEIIEPYKLQESLTKLQTGKQIFETTRRISEQMLKELDLTEITKDRIGLYLLEHNYPQFYEKYIFQFVKQTKKVKGSKKKNVKKRKI